MDKLLLMGSPVGRVLATIFMCDFEEVYDRQHSSFNLAQIYWSCFKAKILSYLFFLQYLKSHCNSIYFTIEIKKKSKKFPCLDILVMQVLSQQFFYDIALPNDDLPWPSHKLHMGLLDAAHR